MRLRPTTRALGTGCATPITLTVQEALLQISLAGAYYLALIVMMRLAGKRLAGQVTMFDLLVLITLGVVLQGAALQPGRANAAIFVLTVFAAHRGLALACARSRWLRRIVRGAPRPLIRDGRIFDEVLDAEGLTRDDLMAGLRKLGMSDPNKVRLAVLEETGHISAVLGDNVHEPSS